ncbi:MAG: DUF1707 domain-containing protein [Candidatus Nanopelagicales bacterium]
MRASDADRDKYAGVLREAYAQGRLSHEEYEERLSVCMTAKTYSELEPLIADLPADNLPVLRPAADVVPVSRSTPPMVAVFSSVERKGAWTLDDTSYAVAVFGEVNIDLREAAIPAADNQIQAFAIFGSVTIYIEPGTVVDCSGIGILGEFNRGKASQPRPGSPVIKVSGLALFGSVSIKEKPLKR